MTKLSSLPALSCCYCGMPGQHYDHVIPVSWTGEKRSKHVDKDNTVVACAECNLLLSNYHLHTISERAEYLSERLTNHYKKELSSPHWSEEELQELGRSLRTTVLRRQLKKLETIDRIRHCKHVASLDMTIEDYWSALATK